MESTSVIQQKGLCKDYPPSERRDSLGRPSRSEETLELGVTSLSQAEVRSLLEAMVRELLGWPGFPRAFRGPSESGELWMARTHGEVMGEVMGA